MFGVMQSMLVLFENTIEQGKLALLMAKNTRLSSMSGEKPSPITVILLPPKGLDKAFTILTALSTTSIVRLAAELQVASPLLLLTTRVYTPRGTPRRVALIIVSLIPVIGNWNILTRLELTR